MPERDHRLYDATKRVVDTGLAAAGLIVSAPIQAAVAAAVLAKHGRPVLFRQERPGLNGEVFELVKFRTMRHPDATHVTDAERLTPLGRFLRATSLDELPTLWNAFKGDMSLVGPRPLLVQYLERYTPTQARRHEVRPGVTGLAQVRGRNGLDWDAKLALDVEYVDHRSFALDARILWETIAVVLTGRGVSAQGHATMEEFKGTLAEERETLAEEARGTLAEERGTSVSKPQTMAEERGTLAEERGTSVSKPQALAEERGTSVSKPAEVNE